MNLFTFFFSECANYKCLFLSDPPENTTISHAEIDVEEGQSPPRVSCTGNAYPPLQYQWVRNGEVKSDGPILHIYEPMKREDDGMYECVSKNKHGNQTAMMRINILCKCQSKFLFFFSKKNFKIISFMPNR